jgi:hypothetical protein
MAALWKVPQPVCQDFRGFDSREEGSSG